MSRSSRRSCSCTASGCFRVAGRRGGSSSKTTDRALAPGWPDDPATVEEAREHPEAFAKKMVQQVTDHYLEAIAGSIGVRS